MKPGEKNEERGELGELVNHIDDRFTGAFTIGRSRFTEAEERFLLENPEEVTRRCMALLDAE